LCRPRAGVKSLELNRTQKQFFLMFPSVAALSTFAALIKVGIIGLDAHAVPWTQIIHRPKAPPPISDLRIVAAVPAPSVDIPFSHLTESSLP
jgi:hypothetical protein